MKNIVIVILSVFSSQCLISQGRQSDTYQYTINFLNNYSENGPSADPEILLVGTFHFRRKKFDVISVQKQILDFSPEAVFVEEVPPSDKSGYKETYKNKLYASERYGNSLYSETIDSCVSFSNVSRLKAPGIINKNYRSLAENPQNMRIRVELINALFINGDDHNAWLQMNYLKKIANSDPDVQFDSLTSSISPLHLKYRFYMGETRYLSVPIATELGISKLYGMDYQIGRKRADSLLSISSQKMVPQLLWKLWKLPYMIKMMKMDKKSPKDEQDAVTYFKILNSRQTQKRMMKLHEVHLYNEKNAASKEWIDLYRKRNSEMVKTITKEIENNAIRKAVVVVGASHVPYFIYELHKQLPGSTIKLLDINQL